MVYASVVENLVRLMLRLPANLHALLTAMARRERRSLNAQIVYLLQQAADQDQKIHGPL